MTLNSYAWFYALIDDSHVIFGKWPWFATVEPRDVFIKALWPHFSQKNPSGHLIRAKYSYNASVLLKRWSKSISESGKSSVNVKLVMAASFDLIETILSTTCDWYGHTEPDFLSLGFCG